MLLFYSLSSSSWFTDRMWFLLVLSWFAILIQLIFVIVSVAAGLYYLAELVEEYTVIAAKVIKYLIFVSCHTQFYLCPHIDSWFVFFCTLLYSPLNYSSVLQFTSYSFYWKICQTLLIIFGLLGQLIYLRILDNFPFIDFA